MKIIILTVGALVEGNSILLLKRNKPPFAGLWCMPGGKFEFGEQIEDCIVREFREETGLETAFRGLRGIVSETINHKGEKEGHFLIFVCALEKLGGKLKESEEGMLEWFDLGRLVHEKERIVGSDLEMIRQMVLGKGEDLKVHKSMMRKDGEKYILESFGAD